MAFADCNVVATMWVRESSQRPNLKTGKVNTRQQQPSETAMEAAASSKIGKHRLVLADEAA